MSKPEIRFVNAPSESCINKAAAVIARHYQKESGSDMELVLVLAKKEEQEKEAKKA